ncbi:DMT family transporter [Sphingomonas psychrotolerans]|uniref:QacE family quaternary ammonium compound efflux SMR transporter n=1 Tax=Sphingomonas psychrotolerans TaxID=1327635 RepID=A0A2K8MJ69_9SPHN|nr:multidrug efflux SMR transporter [Sphingomonas psychrotolerans]ATY33903.1 QacE family quaternary ammonium compound efflux SMR transporter [Sphingomonas psychrotolerans]
MARVDTDSVSPAVTIPVLKVERRIYVWQAYGFLIGAIIAEVSASSFVNKSEYLTKAAPSIIACLLYLLALVLFSQALRSIPLGLGYAIWSGLGITLVSLVSVFYFKQSLDLPAIAGLALIIAGVVLINGFSNSLHTQ